MNVKKIDVSNIIYEYRDKLQEEENIQGKFRKFDIVFIEDEKEDYIAIIDTYDKQRKGYMVRYKNEKGGFGVRCWIDEDKITLVERQNPIEIKDEYDF